MTRKQRLRHEAGKSTQRGAGFFDCFRAALGQGAAFAERVVLLGDDDDRLGWTGCSYLAADVNSLEAYAGTPKTTVLCRDPYAWLREQTPQDLLPQRLEGVHFGIANSQRIIAATRSAQRGLALRHGRGVEYRAAPPLPWKHRPAGRRPAVLVYGRKVHASALQEVQGALITVLGATADVKTMFQEEASDWVLHAIAGDSGASATIHVAIGPGSLDLDEIRFVDAWLNGTPMVQFVPRDMPYVKADPLATVMHGDSGLVAHDLPDLARAVVALISDSHARELIATRAHAYCVGNAPSWAAYVAELAQ